jgi:hypothetical protein
MDPLKKLVAARLGAQVAGQPHPDAELLSALAENALSPKEREGVLEHLGTCAACREVLFLALPHGSDTQKVLAVPTPPPRFAIRWATAAACVVIASAVVVVGRHELTRTAPVAQKAESATVARQQPAIVAMDKAPAEMDDLRESQPPAKTAPAATKALPEAKHITAAPSVALDFKKSGQVVVESAPRSDLKLEAKANELPINGRNRAELMKETPSAAATSPNADMVADSRIKDMPIQGRDAGAPVAGAPASAPTTLQNSVGQPPMTNQSSYAYSAPAAFGLAKQVSGGVLGGTVVDPSGAIVANAKVTTVGPAGTKTITADPNGKFSFDQLPPGQYSLKAAAPGFKTADLEQVAVLAGKPSDIRVMLNVGAVSETVEISAGALAVQTDSADEVTLQAKQKVNGAVATTTESEVAANEKTDNAKSNGKKSAKARQAGIGYGVGAGSGQGIPILQWTLSAEGAVQRSLDGGATWQSVSVSDQRSFRTLSAIGGDVWVGGNAGALYHSADSGQRWTRVVPQVNGEKLMVDITRVSFNDLQNGTVSAANAQVWTTSDGGQSWQRK